MRYTPAGLYPVSCLLQITSISTKLPAQQQTAAPAVKEEEEEEEEAGTAAHKAEADGSQAAKRQKMSRTESEDTQPAVQPVEEARKVAAATKDALGLKGNSSSLFGILTALPSQTSGLKDTYQPCYTEM